MYKLLTLFMALLIWGPPALRFKGRELDAALNDPTALDGAAIFQLAVLGGAGLIAAITIMFRLPNRRGLPIISHFLKGAAFKWYGVYALVALLSVTYSVRPIYTLYASSRFVVAFLVLSLLIERTRTVGTVSKPLNLVFAVFICQWIVIAVLYFVAPQLVGDGGEGGRYRLHGGVFGDYGASAAIAGIYFLTQTLYYSSGVKRIFYGVLYLTTWVFVVLSLTRSMMAGALLFLAILTGLHRRISVKAAAVIISVIGLLAILVSGGGDAIITFLMRGQEVENLKTLTGRSYAFNYLIERWKESPIFGYGYGAGARYFLVDFVKETGLGIGAAHDILSKALIDVGIVGAFCLLMTLLFSWKEMITLWIKTRNIPSLYPLTLQMMAFLTWGTISNVVSPGIGDLDWTYLIIIATMPICHHLAKTHSEPIKANAVKVLRRPAATLQLPVKKIA